MKFWDSSAIIPLLVSEPLSAGLLDALEADGSMTVWWGTSVECGSALARRAFERTLGPAAAASAEADLLRLEGIWTEIAPSSSLRDRARRLLRLHPLRAADALQLAAAWEAAEGRPAELGFVCLDRRLSDAARREGFAVSP